MTETPHGSGALPAGEEFLRDLFQAALAAADPAKAVPGFLPPAPKGRLIVVGAGKASARMAQAVEAGYPDLVDDPESMTGLVIVPYGSKLPCRRIELVEARHPVPDAAGEQAARRIIGLVSNLSEDDLVLCLISGGGSALLTAPGPGMTLADKQAVNKALLASGAPIDEMNAVRKALSAIKGGRLAAASWPAATVTLAISDVPGDDPAIIASGPTVPSRTDAQMAAKILSRRGITMPDAVAAFLATDAAQPIGADHPCWARAETRMIATPQMALEAAAQRAVDLGIAPLVLGDSIEGEAREVGTVMAGIARQICRHGQPAPPPVVLISGGETTVTVRGDVGRGGRNSEFLLAFAHAANGLSQVYALACDTDGIDGSEDNAGAVWGPEIAERAAELGLDSSLYLHRHDAYTYFDHAGALVMTGPTQTNVNDFRAVLIMPAPIGSS